MTKEYIDAVKTGAETLQIAVETFRGAKIIRWLAQRGLCPVWLYKKSLERQIEVSDVMAELERKVIERDNEIKRLEMRTQVALDTERKLLEASGEIYVRESTKQLASVLEENPALGYNTLGLLPLEGRAAHSFVENAINQQFNYEAICLKAIKKNIENGSDKTTNSTPSKDFETIFWNNAKNYSDEVIQDIFAAILSGEINSPGSVSSRALSAISIMSQHELQCLTDFNQYIFNNYLVPIFHSKDKFGLKEGPFDVSLLPRSKRDLEYLSELGILNYDSLGNCMQYSIRPKMHMKIENCTRTYLIKNINETVKNFYFLEIKKPYMEIVRFLPQNYNFEYIEKIKKATIAQGFLWEELEQN